jgi:hypothetical protein
VFLLLNNALIFVLFAALSFLSLGLKGFEEKDIRNSLNSFTWVKLKVSSSVSFKRFMDDV